MENTKYVIKVRDEDGSDEFVKTYKYIVEERDSQGQIVYAWPCKNAEEAIQHMTEDVIQHMIEKLEKQENEKERLLKAHHSASFLVTDLRDIHAKTDSIAMEELISIMLEQAVKIRRVLGRLGEIK